MGNQQGIRRIQKKDLEILFGLYEYRVFTIDQIRRRYEMTKGYAYKKMRLLEQSNYVLSIPIRSHVKLTNTNSNHQGKYYRIATDGLRLLREHGYIEQKTLRLRGLEVSRGFLPYVLLSNDIMIDLEKKGWEYQDSRAAKRMNRLEMGRINNSDLIQGTLRHKEKPENLYGMYILLPQSDETLEEATMHKVIREIKNYKQINNFIIFSRNQSLYNRMFTTMDTTKGFSSRNYSIQQYPYNFGKLYLGKFRDNEDSIISYVEDYTEGLVSFKRRLELDEINSSYSMLRTIIEYDGKEMYLVNLLDSDLVKINQIRQYRKEDYEREGREVLVVSHIPKAHAEFLEGYPHVKYLQINGKELLSYMSE